MSHVGLRIFEDFERVENNLIEQLRNIPTSSLSDVMSQFSSSSTEMKTFHRPGLIMAGSALTVRVPTADNLMVQKAVELAKPGDVIVVEEVGESSYSLLGDLVGTNAKKKGVAGFVINGAIRDREGIYKLKLPTYAKGLVPRGANKNGPGEINVPISCDGIVVYPGDILVGDDDGFVVVPAQEAKAILEKAKEKVEQEDIKMDNILNGTLDQSWIDNLLEEKGCERFDFFKTPRT